MGSFEAIFTGLCAFVPDVEFDDAAKDPTKVMVLMVDAVPSSPPKIRTAIDNELLRFHAPVAFFSSSSLVNQGSIPPEMDLCLPFNRKEISFTLEESVSNSNPFKIIQRTGTDNDFRHTVHIKEILDESASLFKVRSECFDDANSKGFVAARAFLDKGQLKTYDLGKDVEFDVAKTLGGKFSQRPLADRVMLSFNNVDRVHLNFRDLDTADKTEVVFDTAAGSVRILIGNLCGDSWLPRKVNSTPKPIRPSVDDDFRWFYELFSESDKLKLGKTINTLPLPVPVPVKVAGGAGLQPVQCMGLALHAQI